MKAKRFTFATLLAALLGLSFILPMNAYATNQGTRSGVVSGANTCKIDWQASTVMSNQLKNDDPEYPGLMVDLAEGKPVHYSNGGYIQAVSPNLGDPGFLEITHFYLPPRNQLDTQVWRPVIATDHAIKNATATFTLPAGVADLVKAGKAAVSVDTTSVNDRIAKWGPAYAKYTWAPLAADVVKDNHDGTFTLRLGTLPRLTGTVFQINVKELEPGVLDPANKYVAKISLTGDSTTGQCKPQVPAPQVPKPAVCQAVYGGQSIWSVYDGDISTRNKYFWVDNELKTGDNLGEVNNDGWGARPSEWNEGNSRTYRMYAATKQPLKNVVWTIKAEQGVTFTTTNTEQTPGAGLLKANGYTEAVEGVNISLNADGTEFTVTIDSMPANSSFSFNANAALTADARKNEVLVVNHLLTGDLPDCVPTEPATDEPSTPVVDEPSTPASDQPTVPASDQPSAAPTGSAAATPGATPIVGGSAKPSARGAAASKGALARSGADVAGPATAVLAAFVGGAAALAMARKRADR